MKVALLKCLKKCAGALKYLKVLASVLFMFLYVLPAYAVDIDTGINQVDKSQLADKIKKIAFGFGSIAGAICLVLLIVVGLRMMSAGSEQKRAEAKQHFVQILIGLGVIGLAEVIVGFVVWLLKQ